VHSEHISEAIEPLIADGIIQSVLYPVKSGKEATLFCATAGYRLWQCELVAVKVYKPQQFRSFKDDSMYRAGRVILDSRARRAAGKQTRYGREVRSSLWTNGEFETLRLLHSAGAKVPQPLGRTSGAMVMEWIGDAEGPAPQLKDIQLEPEHAQQLFEELRDNIELWLACNIVHGDLSAYNLLYYQAKLVAIDFPQASDPRFNANAESLLARDLSNVCRYFARWGVTAEAYDLAYDLWDRFIRGQL
jgi:RIO kinase 1